MPLLSCPHCASALDIAFKAFGEVIPCPVCGNPFQVPLAVPSRQQEAAPFSNLDEPAPRRRKRGSRLLGCAPGCLAACAAVFAVVFVLAVISTRGLKTPATKETKKEPDEIIVYSPIDEIVCATDPSFLDSSPLIAPARFIRVAPGTELVQVDFGGLFGKMYWGLSAGGEEKIYVYKTTLQSKFREVRRIPKKS